MSAGPRGAWEHLWPRHDMQDGPQAREGTVHLGVRNRIHESCDLGLAFNNITLLPG